MPTSIDEIFALIEQLDDHKKHEFWQYVMHRNPTHSSNQMQEQTVLPGSDDLSKSDSSSHNSQSSAFSISSFKAVRFSTASVFDSTTMNMAKEILLTYDVDDNGIEITVNRIQRPNTINYGSQGDHVTAYVTFLQAVCNLVDGEDVYEAPLLLYEATKVFITNPDELAKFEQDFFKKQQVVEQQFFPRDHRKRLTYELRELNDCREFICELPNGKIKDSILSLVGKSSESEINVKQLKRAIKRGNLVIFAQFVVEVGRALISNYNKELTASLPRLSGADRAEGNRVKEAMRNLRLINKVFELKSKLTPEQSISDTDKVLIDNFREDCKSIITASSGAIKDDTINKNFTDSVSCCKLELELTKTTVQDIRDIICNLDTTKVQYKQIGKLFNDLFDFKEHKIGEAKTEAENYLTEGDKILIFRPYDTLCTVSIRHMHFMFIAFKQIDKLGITQKEEILNGFLEKVIEAPGEGNNNQGWGAYKIISDKGITALKAEILLKKIRSELFDLAETDKPKLKL